jgi:hypothetical protein
VAEFLKDHFEGKKIGGLVVHQQDVHPLLRCQILRRAEGFRYFFHVPSSFEKAAMLAPVPPPVGTAGSGKQDGHSTEGHHRGHHTASEEEPSAVLSLLR